MVLYAATTFLGALLLFVAEPLVAKMLLPLFGGSAAVWIAALLFFQCALLAGYAYADALARRLSPRAQAIAHGAVLLAALLPLPLHASPAVQRALLGTGPTAQVLGVLAAAIGLPYVALAATGPLVQAFWARSRPGSPYRLYALSNLGSMLGLFAYPALLEPWLGLRAQAALWSVAFALFAALCLATALVAARAAGQTAAEAAAGSAPPDAAGASPSAADRNAPVDLRWLLLPALAAALLSAVTIDLTLNVAPIPLLWVLPLAAYLLSFILTFESDRIYRRRSFLPALAVALGFLAWRARSPLRGEQIGFEIGASIVALFVCAMVLHGETVRARPAPSRLTRFYLAIAAGGALGGAFVAVAAPLWFRTELELPVAVLGTAIAVAALIWRERPVIRGLPVQRALRAALVLGVGVLAVQLVVGEATVRKIAVDYDRSFYGPVRVEDDPAPRSERDRFRRLVHGATIHGSQRLSPARTAEPTGYYGPSSGIARALVALRERKPTLRVGVIGLGAGVLAAFCRPGDAYTFFEIDPLIERVARTHFDFLRRCAQAEVVLGDARLTLAARPPQGFDVLILDAFSGDAVPVHLLTTEAFALYARQLAPGALLSLHVSNRFLDLEPVVAAAAAQARRAAWVVEDEGDLAQDLYGTRWTLVFEEAAALDRLGLRGRGVHTLKVPPGFAAWTDDRSHLASLIR